MWNSDEAKASMYQKGLFYCQFSILSEHTDPHRHLKLSVVQSIRWVQFSLSVSQIHPARHQSAGCSGFHHKDGGLALCWYNAVWFWTVSSLHTHTHTPTHIHTHLSWPELLFTSASGHSALSLCNSVVREILFRSRTDKTFSMFVCH